MRCLMKSDVLVSQSTKRNLLYPHPAVLVIPPGISSPYAPHPTVHVIPSSALHPTERTSSHRECHPIRHLIYPSALHPTVHVILLSILIKRVTHLSIVLFITVFLSHRCASRFTADISTMNSTYT